MAVNSADKGTGGVDDWDNPVADSTSTSSATGTLKWEGHADAYYREARSFVTGEGSGTIVLTRTLIINTVVYRQASIDTDDVITFVDPGGVQRISRAARIIVSELPSVVVQDVQTTRLELEDS